MKRLIARSLALVLCILLPSMAIPTCEAHAQEPSVEDDDEFIPSGLDSSRVQQASGSTAEAGLQARPRWQQMLTNVPGDWASSATVAVASRSLPYVAGIGALTGLLMATDRETNNFARRITERSNAVRSASKVLVHLGDGRTHLGIAAAFAVYGLARDDSRSMRTASQTVEALLACGIAVQVMKRITGRESPQAATTDRGVWRFFPNLQSYQKHQPRYYAFPSGHIATTMATVTVIAENYPEVSWIRPVGYSLMGCLGVSLANVGYHWYSDLPLGIALGYAFGMIAAHRQDGLFALRGNDPSTGLRVFPAVRQEGTGVTLALLF